MQIHLIEEGAGEVGEEGGGKEGAGVPGTPYRTMVSKE